MASRLQLRDARSRHRRSEQQQLDAVTSEVTKWNAAVRVGDPVEYRSHPGAQPQRYETSTEAYVLSGHTAVLFLD